MVKKDNAPGTVHVVFAGDSAESTVHAAPVDEHSAITVHMSPAEEHAASTVHAMPATEGGERGVACWKVHMWGRNSQIKLLLFVIFIATIVLFWTMGDLKKWIQDFGRLRVHMLSTRMQRPLVLGRAPLLMYSAIPVQVVGRAQGGGRLWACGNLLHSCGAARSSLATHNCRWLYPGSSVGFLRGPGGSHTGLVPCLSELTVFAQELGR